MRYQHWETIPRSNGFLLPLSVARADTTIVACGSTMVRQHYFRKGDIGGMIISRRPNKRASTENAPGPSKIMATSIIAPKAIGSIELNKFGVQTGSSENPIPIAPMPTMAPAIGVSRPINSNTPAPNAIDPSNQVTCGGFVRSPR